MEIEKELDSRIQEIMRQMQCPKDFECYKSGFDNLGKVRIIGDAALVECLEEKAQTCDFKLSFGYGYMCICPLRKYIAKNLKI